MGCMRQSETEADVQTLSDRRLNNACIVPYNIGLLYIKHYNEPMYQCLCLRIRISFVFLLLKSHVRNLLHFLVPHVKLILLKINFVTRGGV